MGQEEFETLLNFFRALGNETRLKIIGILANRESTVGELAEMLGLKEPTISQHLGMLKHMGLVSVRPEGNHRHYSFNSKALEQLSKDVFSRQKLAALVPDVESLSGDSWERKVLQTFCDGERLVQFPASEKKLLVILRWLAGDFEIDRRYPEKAVNEILTRRNPDYATLRRMLVDYGFLSREKGIYWRVAEAPESAGETSA